MTSVRPTLSLVIPVYNEESTLPELDRRLHGVLDSIGETWEVIFVDDGSDDESAGLLVTMAAREPRYKLLGLTRNFGHQAAITAGLDRANGEAVVVMDADLQDPPEVLSQLLARWREGFHIVYAVRSRRADESWFKRVSAAIFYRLFRAMLGFEVPVDSGDFRLMSRRAVVALRRLRERRRFIRGMVGWVGFKHTSIQYERHSRYAGATKFSLRKMFGFAADGITSFSVVPLRIATWLGAVTGLIAIAAGTWALYERLFATGVVPGWTTIMILIAFSSSVQLLVNGVLGAYIGRIYEEVKRRPLYEIGEEHNFAEQRGSAVGHADDHGESLRPDLGRDAE